MQSRLQQIPTGYRPAKKTLDVVNAVRWARHHNVPIRMRSGHNSYEELSVVDDGIIIDMSDMHRGDVDRKRGTATVQNGIRGGTLHGSWLQ
ncbi:FAD-binding protein [Brevibacillus antibioticus]|nr:FAD-binding protein [Brevibacillus antibioticus]